jgi:chromosome partitioning protein
VSILSPKGGCGKSTTTLVLASSFAENPDLNIAVVDADPRMSIARVWKTRREEQSGKKANFNITTDTNEETFLDTLDATSSKSDLTIIDLEGVNGLMATYAAAASDLCIVPMRPSILDSDAASQAIRMIRDAGRTSRREIKYKVLITQTDSAIQTTSYREMLEELDSLNVPRFKVELMRRAPFERMMTTGQTLYEMDKTNSVLTALSNATAIAKEVEGELSNE